MRWAHTSEMFSNVVAHMFHNLKFLYEDYVMGTFWIYNMSQRMTEPTKWHVYSAKTQIRLGGCPVWSESSLGAHAIL